MTPACECGCGQNVTRATHTKVSLGIRKGDFNRFVSSHSTRAGIRKSGYRLKYLPDHPNAKCDGNVYEHVLMAASALGRSIPKGAEVHHVDGNSLNNDPGNLVLCQDKAYHRLIHYRARVVEKGGNPNTEKWCSDCELIKPLASFNRDSSIKATGLQPICRECQKVRFKKWSAKKPNRT